MEAARESLTRHLEALAAAVRSEPAANYPAGYLAAAANQLRSPSADPRGHRELAARLTQIARTLDGYPLSPEQVQAQRAIVLTAWQLLQALERKPDRHLVGSQP